MRTVSGKSVTYKDAVTSLENIREDASEAKLPKKKTVKKSKSMAKRSKRERFGEFESVSFDAAETLADILARQKSTHRIPGSPLLSIISLRTESITDPVKCTHDEAVRQRGVTEARIYIKLYYNEGEVMRTVVKEIGGGFGVDFCGKDGSKAIDSNYDLTDVKDQEETNSTLISVVVNQEPKSIKAEIYEVVSALSILIKRVRLEIL